MPFLQIRKIKNMVKFFGIFLALFTVAGCAAQNSKKADVSEQIQPIISESEFKKAEKKVISGTQIQIVEAEQKRVDADQSEAPQIVSSKEKPMGKPMGKPMAKTVAKTMAEKIFGVKKQYTGEKIKLDFYETDIKNVFRILRSVGKLNFAIDKNVEGKVTLTLEDPVPWDQVLDLVLKMNNLGMKKEDNVIRIATLDTLKKDTKLQQDAIVARKKLLEQKKSLEPLVTEFIPINYSDINAVIKHIKSSIPSPRRHMSAVEEIDQIVITDTIANIGKVRELVTQIDKVTAQVMIEAKVVEVTRNFARNLGLSWNLMNDSNKMNNFVDDFSVSVSETGIAGEVSFFRLFGSNVTALNAMLDASEEKGDVEVISSPRILTIDGEEAEITQGQQIPFTVIDDAGNSIPDYKDVLLSLKVKPDIKQDNRILMEISLNNDSKSDESVGGEPLIDKNTIQTKLIVNDRGTIVIGGIIKTTKSDKNFGLPFLTGIPVLGTIFGKNSKKELRKELLIFITPSIVQLEKKK